MLYISENDDFELWRALCQFTPEERASVVKTALKKALLEEYSSQSASRQLSPDHESPSAVRNPLKSGADISGDITPKSVFGFTAPKSLAQSSVTPVPEAPSPEIAGAVASYPINDLILDDLGTELIDPQINEDLTSSELTDLNDLSIFIQSEESPDKNSIPGLNFLLTNVIGEEDDETVVEYIRKMRASNDEDAG
ncbi:MAG: hypothetical protein GX248_00165 [Peptococcaceae bacterium]|nr:hypothetical protein [Peptococcaceae bacterium]